MRPHRPIVLGLLFVAFGVGRGPAFGGDSPAEATLKGKGLAKSGRVFVIEDEKPVLAKMKDVRASFAAYAMVADKQAASERSEAQAAHLEEQRVALKAQLDELNDQILIMQGTSTGGNALPRQGPGNGQPGGAGPVSPLLMQRQQVTTALAEVAVAQKALKAESPVVKDKAALDDEVKKRGEAFKSSLADLRKMVDEVTKKYADLAADPTVKKSLADLEKAAKAKLKLGPSDAFAAGMKELDQAEKRFLGKKTTAPAKSKKKATNAKK
jgi:hypothetical protein